MKEPLSLVLALCPLPSCACAAEDGKIAFPLPFEGFILLMSRRLRSMAALLVADIMVGYICSAVTFAEDSGIANLRGWSPGSLSGARWEGVGAAFCMGCDLIARTAFAPTELSISTVTSVFGAPVVIDMMRKRRQAQ